MISSTFNKYPGLTCKAWVQFSSAGAVIKSSNVTSVTKGGAGVYTVVFTNAMATTTYMLEAFGIRATNTVAAITTEATTAQCDVNLYNGGAASDMSGYVAFYE